MTMRQRITHFLPERRRVDPADIEVEKGGLNFTRSQEAAEEWRLTLSLDELPDEIREVLNQSRELHLRWQSPLNDALVSPLLSRVTTGLHVFFTPRNSKNNVDLCSLVKKFLATRTVKCDSIADTFSTPRVLSERFTSSSMYQYYHLGSVDQYIGVNLLERLCTGEPSALHACKEQVQDLENATYIDVDFDAISHALILTAFWNPNRRQILPSRRHQRSIKQTDCGETIEVGVLQSEEATEPEELSMGGYLTVIGESERPKLTLFSFPSRHHPLPDESKTSFHVSFQHPTGLHPQFEVTLPRQNLKPPKSTCALHTYWTLPSNIFIDRYQLSDALFLASQNLVALHSLSGEDDLEAPEWVTDRWGSAILLEVATPSPDDRGGEWRIKIPTHLRYLNGQKHDVGEPDKTTIDVPWPVLFWACEAEEGLKMSTNPFDRVNLGYDVLFGPKTMFYHIPAAPDVVSTVSQITVPILDAENGQWIKGGTLVAVVAGFAFIFWQLLQSVRSGGLAQEQKRKTP